MSEPTEKIENAESLEELRKRYDEIDADMSFIDDGSFSDENLSRVQAKQERLEAIRTRAKELRAIQPGEDE